MAGRVFNISPGLGQLLANAVKQTQIDQGVDQGINVGDGSAIANVRSFNAKS
jgi:hypothetical protein